MSLPERQHSRRPPALLPAFLAVFFCALLPGVPASAQSLLDDNLPDAPSAEPVSPDEQLTGTVNPGLSERAIPPMRPPERPPVDYSPLYRLTRPYYDSLFSTRPPREMETPDPALFRPVIIYQPPLGLQPRIPRPGLLELSVSFGISQSFDSNVNLTPTDPIRDFYVTPRATVEFQLGSPDSIYSEGYDTILALHGMYEGYGDIFYEHPELSAYNQRFDLTGRIGRSAAIWRPYLSYSDLTGSNLLMVELMDRTRRIRLNTGFAGEYRFTELTSVRQTFNYGIFDHPDPTYINFTSFTTRQEIAYRFLKATKALVWAQYRYTWPDRGFPGGEITIGPGWQGQPDPRIYSELHVGWGFLNMEGYVPGRTNLSGLRFDGYTTFDWGPRFRPTFRYDREYAFNEIDENDNYVSTLIQFRNEFFLGGNYYLTPYLGVALDEFETSHRLILQFRPEIELSYALPSESLPNQSRVFVKFGYQSSNTIRGEGDPIEQFRVSVGCNWKY